jgi:hypothetical protein
MGGADIGQQFIRSGLVDELSIHLVPVIFGGGTRMFENLASSSGSSRSSRSFRGRPPPTSATASGERLRFMASERCCRESTPADEIRHRHRSNLQDVNNHTEVHHGREGD